MSQNFMDTLFYIQTLRGRQERERQAQLAAQMAPIQQAVDESQAYGDKLQASNEEIAQTRGQLGDTRTYDDPRLTALADLGARESLRAREKAAMLRQQALDDAAGKQAGAVIQSRLDDPMARVVRNKTGFEMDTPEFEKAYAAEQANAARQKLLEAAAGRSSASNQPIVLTPASVETILSGNAPMPVGRGAAATAQVLNTLTGAGDFDATLYGARDRLRKSVEAGKDAQISDSHNMLIQHVDEVIKAGERMGSTDYPLVNKAINMYSTATGEDPVVAFNQAASAAAAEAERLFSGTGGSAEADRAHRRALLDPSLSPKQRLESAKMLIKLASGRIGAVQNRWNRVMQEPLDIYSPQSKEILQGLGLQETGPDTRGRTRRAAEIRAELSQLKALLQQSGGQ